MFRKEKKKILKQYHRNKKKHCQTFQCVCLLHKFFEYFGLKQILTSMDFADSTPSSLISNFHAAVKLGGKLALTYHSNAWCGIEKKNSYPFRNLDTFSLLRLCSLFIFQDMKSYYWTSPLMWFSMDPTFSVSCDHQRYG